MVYFKNEIISFIRTRLSVYFRLIICFVPKVCRADLYTRSRACSHPSMDRHFDLDGEYKNPS